MGAWVGYGLGSMNDNLPTFVVLPDARAFRPTARATGAPAFLPAAHQGTLIRPPPRTRSPICFRRPTPASSRPRARPTAWRCSSSSTPATCDDREGDSRLDARIASYELAARLQLSAPEVLDISGETEATRRLYGLDEKITEDFGRNCLVARRLLERGVRFVQVWSGADNGFPRRNWDSHEDLARDHGDMGTQHGPARPRP